MSNFVTKCNNLIGSKEFDSCVHLASYLFPEFQEILTKYIDPTSRNFDRKKGTAIGLKMLEEVNYNSREDNNLIVFYNTKNSGVHVGICVNKKMIHWTKEGIMFVSIKDILNKKMPTFKIFKLKKEIRSDYN